MKLMASQANGRHLCCHWQSPSKLGKMPLLTNQKGCCHIAILSLRGLQICNHCTQGFFHLCILCLSDFSPLSTDMPRMFTDFSFIWAWTHHCYNASLTNTHFCNRRKSNKLQLHPKRMTRNLPLSFLLILQLLSINHDFLKALTKTNIFLPLFKSPEWRGENLVFPYSPK